jgi:Tfp pilus assembly protein PilE
MRKKRGRGVSVVEAIVAVALMAMVAGTATVLFHGAAHSYVRSTTRTTVHRTLTTLADLCMNDGRHAATYNVTTEAGMTQIYFRSLTSAGIQPYTITYSWHHQDQQVRRTVIQEKPAMTITDDVVATGVTTVTGETNTDGKGLTLTMTSGTGEHQSQIKLRLTTRLTPSQPMQSSYYSPIFWKHYWAAWGWGISQSYK